MRFSTVFDKIIRKEIKSDIVYEDDFCLAFKDIMPKAETHILIIPKDRDGLDRISSAQKRHEQTLGKLLLKTTEIAKQLSLDGYRLVINDGEKGGQTIFHLHIHLLSGKNLPGFH
ncbi:Adenosine 5'-monophosphoramidase [Paramecium bursaria]